MPKRSGWLGFRDTYEPDIMDLDRYEADLLLQRSRGIPLMPPPSIPGMAIGEWTVAEMEAMKLNRSTARAVYDRIKANA